MSAALFVLLLVVAGTKNALAQTQVVTLQHGEDISVFYGTNAFVEAHTAAADGDIVTLSSGSYNTPTQITKAITIRGAGVVADTVAGTDRTIFAQSVTFNVLNDSIAVNMEGILFTSAMLYKHLHNPKFTRCSFNSISRIGNTIGPTMLFNALFVNCMVNTFDYTGASGTMLVNSVVWKNVGLSSTSDSNPRAVILYNSIFRAGSSNSSGFMIAGVSAFNSIIIGHSTTTTTYQNYSSANSFINCIGIQLSSYASVFGSAYIAGCITKTSYEAVFESLTGTGTLTLESPCILKDEIATGFLGSDGTQVGIYGGFMPYSNHPSYMVLKRYGAEAMQRGQPFHH